MRRPDATIAVADHNIPTTDRRSGGIKEEDSRIQVETLERNVTEFGVPYIPILDVRQGIVHIIGPELGLSLPGMTIVCGDSHTSTHGALGALAFGIGTSEVEHVLATQTLLQKPAKNMLVRVDGALPFGATAKDIVLAIIGQIGTAGGTGHVIEFAGEAIRALDMAGRMTVCNMSIEAGARAGMIAPDETTFAYVKGRDYAPKGDAFDRRWRIGARCPPIPARTTTRRWCWTPPRSRRWSPGAPIPGPWCRSPAWCPTRPAKPDEAERAQMQRMLDYMALKPGHEMHDVPIDVVFIGSCTNGRIEDIRAAAAVAQGPQGRRRCAGAGGARLRPREAAGGAGRAGPHPAGSRFRMARAVLLDVPRHEPRQADAGPALRQHVQPQFRGPPGAGRTDASAVAGNGGCRGGDRPAGRCAGVGLMEAWTISPR